MTLPTSPSDEVVRICRDLIRIDTSNYGDGSGPGEAEAAAYVVEQLREVGLEPQTFESDPGRVSVAVRIPGADRERGALCVHGHLDVVPANAADWSVDPFGAEEKDGCIWGRGAVDMGNGRQSFTPFGAHRENPGHETRQPRAALRPYEIALRAYRRHHRRNGAE